MKLFIAVNCLVNVCFLFVRKYVEKLGGTCNVNVVSSPYLCPIYRNLCYTTACYVEDIDIMITDANKVPILHLFAAIIVTPKIIEKKKSKHLHESNITRLSIAEITIIYSGLRFSINMQIRL